MGFLAHIHHDGTQPEGNDTNLSGIAVLAMPRKTEGRRGNLENFMVVYFHEKRAELTSYMRFLYCCSDAAILGAKLLIWSDMSIWTPTEYDGEMSLLYEKRFLC